MNFTSTFFGVLFIFYLKNERVTEQLHYLKSAIQKAYFVLLHMTTLAQTFTKHSENVLENRNHVQHLRLREMFQSLSDSNDKLADDSAIHGIHESCYQKSIFDSLMSLYY